MIYTYSKAELQFKKVTKRLVTIVITVLAITSFVTYQYTTQIAREQVLNDLSPEERLIIINKGRKAFESDQFITLLNEMNVKYPHIVMAQSIIETGHWTSKVFRKNNNLFGMKQAYRRVNTAKGTQHNHAFYESWEESVYDYAFYQCRYLSTINNEQEYFQYLSKSYAEDPNYVTSLKNVIEKEQLRKKFQ